MTLAEAIRAGSSKTYQVFGRCVHQDNGQIRGACAFFAALVGYHKTVDAKRIPDDSPLWRIVIRSRCPVCRNEDVRVVEHLNDNHLWTCEAIAGWLVESGLDREILAG